MQTIDGVFAQKVREVPDAIAVSAHDGDLTYTELDARANRTAHHLCRHGVRPGDVVAIHAERSAASVVMLLAVLKAGAAYLALDTRHPYERRQAMLDDASAKVVLTQQHLAAGLSAHGRTLISLDGHWPSIAEEPATPPAVMTGPEDIAYVAYTSGSTGRPKGVCVPHRAVLRLVVGTDIADLRDDDVFLQFAPLAFDASTWETWGALLAGARLAVAPPGQLTPDELTLHARRAGVTVMWLTAGLFHQVVDSGLENLRGLRYLLAGGDVLSAPHVARALEALPGTTIVNGYGPTENTTFTCCHTVRDVPATGTVPIGKPITGTAVQVLDGRLHPVPDGEAGELYTTGLGLAHGYLGSPGRTAERFVADPYSDVPGARMYRTGDFVRRLPDGTLEFLGRDDDQVKIRGFRVETGEVESTLASLPDVAHAAVVAQRAPSGEHRLIGYVVAASGAEVSALETRERLERVLPQYCVPALVRILDALPLTENGKVDRVALVDAGGQDRPELSAPYRSPESPLERAITQLWTDQIGIVGIGADDDFFEIGGHSLLAVTILTELRRGYGVEISPRSLYLDPSPAGLARAVEQARSEP
ncbi:non-ribosomal peptide synthetase [Streptomyces sp. W16]|uniref:non-ribosomal peptide synthetase n=1 Tax=Streptomyces sp. W16 TaxID=3076631 RepID=UPI00295AAA6A|nr:non-ribosomal peptide synthetase [Streptomyces sp. W16]MDV9169312.1 non-ribosomal peptide synthetase [Streptomyces sp. W16]